MDSSKLSVVKIVVDVVLLAIPAVVALILNLVLTPFQRNFFCNDESLMYPYQYDTITTLTLALVGIFTSISFILIVETVLKINNSYKYNDNDRVTKTLLKFNISPFVQNLYQYIGLLLFAKAINQFLTDGTKFAVGRLRPHFVDICRPQMMDGTTCKDAINWNSYISDFICTNPDATQKQLNDMRLSFPSGHSSYAFVTAFYCVFYLQSRMTYRGSKILKHFIQLLFIAGASYTGLSRISDYKHHYSDVLAGSILGFLVAYTVCFHVSDLFKVRLMKRSLPR